MFPTLLWFWDSDRALHVMCALGIASAAVLTVGVLPWILGYTTPVYGVAAVLLGLGFVWYAWKVLGMTDDDRVMKPAKALFAYSLLYLFAIFAAYLADSVVERALAMGGA